MKWKNKFFIGIFDRIFRAFSNWIEMAIIDPKDLSQRIIWIFWTRSTHKCLIWLAKSLNFRRFYVPFSPGFFKNFPRGSGSGLEKNPRGNPGRETPGLTPKQQGHLYTQVFCGLCILESWPFLLVVWWPLRRGSFPLHQNHYARHILLMLMLHVTYSSCLFLPYWKSVIPY